MNYNPEDDEEEEEEEDIAVCSNCGGVGCSICDYDGVVDLNYIDPDGTN